MPLDRLWVEFANRARTGITIQLLQEFESLPPSLIEVSHFDAVGILILLA